MVQVSFGTALRNARERKGYDIATVARRLRIRPDILRAIEESDFERMPPKGYARNMINAYARYLGLNPTEITSKYLDESYAYQVKTARSNARPTGVEMPSSSRRGAHQKSNSQTSEEIPRQSKFGRTLYVDDRLTGSHRAESSHGVSRLYSDDKTHRSTRAAVPSSQYTNFYSGPKASHSRLPFIIGGAVILVLLIIILVLLFSPKGSESNGDVERLPVTGVTGTTNSEEQSPVELAPTKIVFEYEIPEGQSAYIQVTQDDKLIVADVINGPAKQPYDVTGTFVFETANPDGVKVYQEGTDREELKLTDPDGDGMYSVTVDFPAYLAQWKKDHPSVTGDSSDATGTSGSTNSSNATDPAGSTDSSNAANSTDATDTANTSNAAGETDYSEEADYYGATDYTDATNYYDTNGYYNTNDYYDTNDYSGSTDYYDTSGSNAASDYYDANDYTANSVEGTSYYDDSAAYA